MNIITESYDDDEDEEEVPSLETHVLEKGTVVYHGTNGKFDERGGLDSPVWITDSVETARHFARWKDDLGKPRLTVWEVYYPIKLAVLTEEYLNYLGEYMMIDMMDGPHDVLQQLKLAGFDGWIIPDNYGTQQADICIGDSSALKHVKTEILKGK